MEIISSLHQLPVPALPCSGFTIPALGKYYKASSRMGNTERMLREIREAVTAAGAWITG